MFQNCLYCFLLVLLLHSASSGKDTFSLSATIHKPDVVSFKAKRIDAGNGKSAYDLDMEIKDTDLWQGRFDVTAYTKNAQTGKYDKELFKKSAAFCRILEGKPLFERENMKWFNCEKMGNLKNVKVSGFHPKLIDGIAPKGETVKLQGVLHYKNEPAVTWVIYMVS